jgi:hypothetical protein
MRTDGVPTVGVTALRVAAETPHQHFRVLRNPERSAPHVIAMPSRRVPRVSSDISCRGTHLHSWSHRYFRSLCDHNVRFFPQIRGGCRMNSRESSIRTCQLGPNRWNRSPRAWACVSCVSEDVLPASDPHLYGFEGNGNAVEKRPHHRDFLSAGAHKWCNGSVPGPS